MRRGMTLPRVAYVDPTTKPKGPPIRFCPPPSPGGFFPLQFEELGDKRDRWKSGGIEEKSSLLSSNMTEIESMSVEPRNSRL